MIIGIDGNEGNTENRVGVNQYTFEMLWSFSNLLKSGQIDHGFVIYLKKEPLNLPPESEKWKYVVLPGGGKWIIKKLLPRLLVNKEKIDLFFAPSHYLPPISKVPQICAIMDLGYLKFSEQFKKYDFWQLKLWSAWSLFISNQVLTISKATQADVAKYYPFASKKTKVTLLAGDTNVFNAKLSDKKIDSVKKKYGIRGDYVLFLGTLKPSKNVEGLISAWAEVSKNHSETLVVAGKKGWLFETIFDLVKSLNLEKRVVFTDFVEDSEKPYLVKGAKAFVLPSFWEGFGIDVLNAYACGVPVVVSNRGSLPEVAGKMGIYIDPEKPEEIAAGINKVLLMNKKEYNKLSEACRKQAAKFSWEKTARETIKVFESI